jgi:hypothetical protein
MLAPVVTKNKPSRIPLNGLRSASTCKSQQFIVELGKVYAKPAHRTSLAWEAVALNCTAAPECCNLSLRAVRQLQRHPWCLRSPASGSIGWHPSPLGGSVRRTSHRCETPPPADNTGATVMTLQSQLIPSPCSIPRMRP